MPRLSPRPHPNARSLVGLAALLFGAVAASRARAEEPIIQASDVRIDVPFEQLLLRDGWTALRVSVRNTGGNFSGRLIVRGLKTVPGGQVPSPLAFERRFEIPTRTTRQVTVPIRLAHESAALVTIESDELRVRARKDFAWTPGARARLLVISDTGYKDAGLRAFVRSLANRPEDSDASAFLDDREIVATQQVLPRDLPEHVAAYDCVTMVLLLRTALELATPAAMQALRGWVENGGTLVALPTDTWSSPDAAPLLELLSVRSTVEPSPEDIAFAMRDRELGPDLYWHGLEPADDAPLVSDDLRLRLRAGLGQITVLRFVPTGDQWPKPVVAGDFYRLLRRPLARGLSFAGTPEPALRMVEYTTAKPLFVSTGFRLPSRLLIGLFFLAYVGIGLVLPWRLLRKSRRREWTFLWTTVLGVGCTVGIWAFGLLGALDGPVHAGLDVVRVPTGDSASHVTSVSCRIAPTLRRVDAIPSEDLIDASTLRSVPMASASWSFPQLILGACGWNPSNTPIDMPRMNCRVSESHRGLSLPRLTLLPNGPRYFRCDYTLVASDTGTQSVDTALSQRIRSPLEISREPGGRLCVNVVNDTPVPLRLGCLQGQSLVLFADLEPGEERTLEDPIWNGEGADNAGQLSLARMLSFSPDGHAKYTSELFGTTSLGWLAGDEIDEVDDVATGLERSLTAPLDGALFATLWCVGRSQDLHASGGDPLAFTNDMSQGSLWSDRVREVAPSYIVAWAATHVLSSSDGAERRGWSLWVAEIPDNDISTD